MTEWRDWSQFQTPAMEVMHRNPDPDDLMHHGGEQCPERCGGFRCTRYAGHPEERGHETWAAGLGRVTQAWGRPT